MAGTCFHNVYVGTETGLLKGVHLEKNSWDNINSVEKLDKENEISCMCWGNSEETEVCFGTKSRLIQTYDVSEGEFKNNQQCLGGSGKLCGLSKYNNRFLSATESGLVKVWTKEENETSVEISAGENVCVMRHSREKQHLVATGGKENDLKLWDLSRPDLPLFKAKNVRNDWLNLRVPVWVLGMEFLPGTDRLITCTGHHQVRIYDPSSSQRRPVLSMEFDEYPLTAISLTPDTHQVVVGNTQGKMALMDIRKGKMVQLYKGFAGGIRGVQCHPTMPLVASCGLDRFLRVHNIHSGELLHKIYLKSRLNCMLFGTKWRPDVREADKTLLTNTEKSWAEEDSDNDSGNEDDIWSNMKAVKTKTVPKRKADNAKQITSSEKSVKKTKTSKEKTKLRKKIKSA